MLVFPIFSRNFNWKLFLLVPRHLLCELSAETLDLCWFERHPHFGLPDFWLVNIFRLRFWYQNQEILTVGKIFFGIGKTAVSIIFRRNKQSFHRPIPTIRHHFPCFFLFKLNSSSANSIRC